MAKKITGVVKPKVTPAAALLVLADLSSEQWQTLVESEPDKVGTLVYALIAHGLATPPKAYL